MKVLVVGMEKSGRAALEFLRARGDDATATDLKACEVAGFRPQSEDLFDERWDAIVISPGVPADLAGLERARARGVDVIGEVELAANRRLDASPRFEELDKSLYWLINCSLPSGNRTVETVRS